MSGRTSGEYLVTENTEGDILHTENIERDSIIGQKDVDRQLMYYLEDHQILNMMLNKKYTELLNEEFFKFLVKWKPENQSFKQYYIQCTIWPNFKKWEFPISPLQTLTQFEILK